MRRASLLYLGLLLSLPCNAQWKSVGFNRKIIAFGAHDSCLFISYVAQSGLDFHPFLRYIPSSDTWDGDDTAGIDWSQGRSITCFTSLGKSFYIGMDTLGRGASFCSADNGHTWTRAVNSPIFANGTYLFSTTGTSVYRSMDSGKKWNGVPCPAAIAFTGHGANVVTSTPNGMYYSTDSGTSWTKASSPLGNVQTFAMTNTAIYATDGISGVHSGQLMRSIDSGAHWSLMSINFPVVSLATDGSHLFAGGDSGIFLLDSLGTNWISENGGLNPHKILNLGVFDTVLFANLSVPGYQLYSRSIPEMLRCDRSAVSLAPHQDTIMVYPNPTTGLITIHSEPSAIETVSVLSLLGAHLLNVAHVRSVDVTVDLSTIASGTYFLAITRIDGSTIRKIIRE